MAPPPRLLPPPWRPPAEAAALALALALAGDTRAFIVTPPSGRGGGALPRLGPLPPPRGKPTAGRRNGDATAAARPPAPTPHSPEAVDGPAAAGTGRGRKAAMTMAPRGASVPTRLTSYVREEVQSQKARSHAGPPRAGRAGAWAAAPQRGPRRSQQHPRGKSTLLCDGVAAVWAIAVGLGQGRALRLASPWNPRRQWGEKETPKCGYLRLSLATTQLVSLNHPIGLFGGLVKGHFAYSNAHGAFLVESRPHVAADVSVGADAVHPPGPPRGLVGHRRPADR